MVLSGARWFQLVVQLVLTGYKISYGVDVQNFFLGHPVLLVICNVPSPQLQPYESSWWQHLIGNPCFLSGGLFVLAGIPAKQFLYSCIHFYKCKEDNLELLINLWLACLALWEKCWSNFLSQIWYLFTRMLSERILSNGCKILIPLKLSSGGRISKLTNNVRNRIRGFHFRGT